MTLSRPDDNQMQELVEQAIKGEESAFEQLYKLNYQAMCRYLSFLLESHQDVEECAQDTFEKAWKGLPSLREAASFKPWLYRIAKNLALNALEHRKRFSFLPLGKLVNSSLEERLAFPGPEGQVEDRMLLRQLRAQVPLKYWNCFILRRILKFSKDETAEIVGINKNSVDTYVIRA